MLTDVTNVTVQVEDVDEAKEWYTGTFGSGERTAETCELIVRGSTTVLATDDFRATVAELEERGVTVTTPPEEVPWGVHANVVDCYGNPHNLVEGLRSAGNARVPPSDAKGVGRDRR